MGIKVVKPTILIIKTGSTYKELRAIRGDFDKWICRVAPTEINWKTKAVADIELSKIPQYQGIIITGSHNSLCNPYPYLKGLKQVIDLILQYKIPTLGICFGHQLIHKLLGGDVIANPLGIEIGVTKIQLTLDALVDPIFQGIPVGKLEVYSSHSDIVDKPASTSVKLAWNIFSEYQATRIYGHIYSTQFHPEYDRDIMETYIRRNWMLLQEQHLHNPLHISPPEEILRNNKQLTKSKLVLRNFLQMVI